MKALCIGRSIYNTNIFVDSFLPEGASVVFNDISQSISGFAAICSYLLGKYTFESYIASGIGDDSNGNGLKKVLEKANVHTEYIETFYEKKTITSNTFINKISKKSTVLTIEQEKLNLKKNDFLLVPDIILTDGYDYSCSLTAFNKYPKAKAIFFATFCNSETLELAKYAKYIVATQEFCEYVSGIKMNFATPQTLVDSYMKLIKKFQEKTVVVSLKEKGTLYIKDNQIKVLPALKLEIVDNASCDDVFASAFGLAIAYNYEIEKAVTFASIASSVYSSKKGMEAFDDLSTINTYFNQKYPKTSNDNQ